MATPEPSGNQQTYYDQSLSIQKQILDELKENNLAIRQLEQTMVDLLSPKHMYRIDPYEITLTTSSQRVLTDTHQRNVTSLMIALNDVTGMGASDYVSIGRNGMEKLRLYGLGDFISWDYPDGNYNDSGDIFIKTSGGTPKVVVTGVYYEADYL